MKKSLVVFTLLVVLSSLLASCAGASAPATTIDVTMTDFQFAPAQFTIAAGQEITVNATNNGAVLHEFVIFKLGLNPGEKFGDEDEDNIFWEVEVEPAATTTVTFTAPTEPGEYYLMCGTEGHLEAGMIGSVTVK